MAKDRKTSQKARKQVQQKRVTYIIKRSGGALYAAPMWSHASPSGIFTVRGHYRRYKSGKIIWISEYKKGEGKRKPKTYKLGKAKTDPE